jgi:prophage tail gpP-like protein
MADNTVTLPDVVNTAQAPTRNPAQQLPPGSSDQNELTIALTPANATRPVILSGWQRFRARRSIEHAPSQLVIETTERFPSSIAEATTPFSKATVKIGQDQIMGCYIDLVEPHIDKGRHEVVIAARSLSQDLVDCMVATDKMKSWVVRDATLGAAVKTLAAPYDIPLTVIGEDPKINQPGQDVVQINPGMTNWMVIEQLGSVTERLIYDGVDGGIVISKVGTERSACALIQGQNIEFGSARLSGDQRYSQITVASQAVILDASSSPVISLRQDATDPRVPRYRNLLMILDLVGPDAKWAQQRADWEVARRYGRSREIRIVVSGFRTSRGGALWDINTIVQVDAPALKVSKEDMVVAGVTFIRDDLGTRTELVCMPADGLRPPPHHFVGSVPVTPQDQQKIDAAAAGTPTTDQIIAKGGT